MPSNRGGGQLAFWNPSVWPLDGGRGRQGVVADERAELDMSAYGEVETLDDYSAGKLDAWDRPLTFGQTPAVLRMLGAPVLRMTITRDVLNKVTRDKHSLDIDELRKLTDSMHEPLAVFRSGTQLDSMVVLTEMQEQGKPVVAAIHLDSTQGHLRVNKIASVYGKDNSLGLFSGDILYADKTKIGKWSTTRGLQLPKVVQSISRGHRVLNPGDVVKWKNENNLPQVHFSIFGMTAQEAARYLENAIGQRKAHSADSDMGWYRIRNAMSRFFLQTFDYKRF